MASAPRVHSASMIWSSSLVSLFAIVAPTMTVVDATTLAPPVENFSGELFIEKRRRVEFGRIDAARESRNHADLHVTHRRIKGFREAAGVGIERQQASPGGPSLALDGFHQRTPDSPAARLGIDQQFA